MQMIFLFLLPSYVTVLGSKKVCTERRNRSVYNYQQCCYYFILLFIFIYLFFAVKSSELNVSRGFGKIPGKKPHVSHQGLVFD